jgi:hypothetical protein
MPFQHLNKTVIVLLVLLTALVVIMFVGLTMALYPYQPIRVDKFCIDKTVVTHGEKVCFRFEGEKFMPVPVNVLIELANGENIEIMKYTSNNPVGTTFKQRCFLMPHHVIPNRYQIRWTGVYPVNALNRKTVSSQWITVVSDPLTKGEKGDPGPQGKQGAKGDKGGFSFGGGK